MKRRRTPPSPRLKKRYNLVHRLRLQGIAVDTVGNAINIATEEELDSLPELAKKYILELQDRPHLFAIQTYIPSADDPAIPIKFTRRHHRSMTEQQVLDLAAWPPCPLPLPEHISRPQRGDIVNVPRYISLHLSRLDSTSKRLARLSREALDELITIITQPSTT